ncbi:unnamed protein product [Didymodactylos carnosus]|uniref:F-box domain-containing protein n=1 Tax=Didymodactylos carnosus TaxID=1234261 RepID=A0A815UQ29_9BILA|nr:unnamed protein product [Didymodactylos carnosus]CAF4378747.1 unnamed protein product [Didymodactylos carnosus]
MLTLEALPDEILMLIIGYSGDVYNVLKAFLGLNQRLNNILMDKRLHLLADLLIIAKDDRKFDYYCRCIFQKVSQSDNNRCQTEEQIRSSLQSLVLLQMRDGYTSFEQEIKSQTEQYELIREQLINDEAVAVDNELYDVFRNLEHNSMNAAHIEQTCSLINSLVMAKGARLKCDDYELARFNFAKAVNTFLLFAIASPTKLKQTESRRFKSVVEIFKLLLILGHM